MHKALIASVIIVSQGVILYLMGQPAICECGTIKVWEGVVLGPGNSQHLSDWYTPSHVIHGILFYLLLWKLFPRISVPIRLLIAICLEVSWEIFENTPFIIDRYREQALAQGYVGDSIINSISDTLAMIGGFLIAWRAPLWASIILVLLLELLVGYWIRDNLTLNVIQLLWPLDAISQWQSGN